MLHAMWAPTMQPGFQDEGLLRVLSVGVTHTPSFQTVIDFRSKITTVLRASYALGRCMLLEHANHMLAELLHGEEDRAPCMSGICSVLACGAVFVL